MSVGLLLKGLPPWPADTGAEQWHDGATPWQRLHGLNTARPGMGGGHVVENLSLISESEG